MSTHHLRPATPSHVMILALESFEIRLFHQTIFFAHRRSVIEHLALSATLSAVSVRAI